MELEFHMSVGGTVIDRPASPVRVGVRRRRWQDLTIAAGTNPYLPASFPFANGKEESPLRRWCSFPRARLRGVGMQVKAVARLEHRCRCQPLSPNLFPLCEGVRGAVEWFPRARGNLKEGVFGEATVRPYLPLSARARGKVGTGALWGGGLKEGGVVVEGEALTASNSFHASLMPGKVLCRQDCGLPS